VQEGYGGPPRPSRWYSDDAASLEAFVVEVRRLREQIERLTKLLSARDARVAELEKLLENSRRSGKRQVAPFSKDGPVEEAKRPGRRSGKDHGRHGHRAAPVGRLDRELSVPLPSCCPDCDEELVDERDAEQFQYDLSESRPIVTWFTYRCERGGLVTVRDLIAVTNLASLVEFVNATRQQVASKSSSSNVTDEADVGTGKPDLARSGHPGRDMRALRTAAQ